MEKTKQLPKELIICNGEFDLVNPKLSEEWKGRVFIHPPHDRKNLELFLEKMAVHGNGIALLFNRSDSKTFHKHVLKRSHGLFYLQHRFYYLDEKGKKHKENCGGAVLFVAYGQTNSSLLKHCKLEGIYVPLIRRYTKKKSIDTLTEKIEL